jgi:hypothetical protein
MQSARRLDLVAHRGLTFWVNLVFLENLTGMTAAEFSVRSNPDNPTAIITAPLGTTGEKVILDYAATDTVANHILANYLGTEILRETNPETAAPYDLTDTIDVSSVRMVIGTVDNRFPAPQEVGDDWIGGYDLILTPNGQPAQKYAFGKFTVKPRANQA